MPDKISVYSTNQERIQSVHSPWVDPKRRWEAKKNAHPTFETTRLCTQSCGMPHAIHVQTKLRARRFHRLLGSIDQVLASRVQKSSKIQGGNEQRTNAHKRAHLTSNFQQHPSASRPRVQRDRHVYSRRALSIVIQKAIDYKQSA
ncbi:hypothetical protein Ae201684P_012866 [Aphanomyces euteiches]|nr:hypothetical protein Ae201684P_012866 [Aphanomyces euteiches]